MPQTLAEFPNVPMLGQTCEVLAWFPTISIACKCEKKTPLLLVGQRAIVTCQACQKTFTIGAIHLEPQRRIGRIEIAELQAVEPGRA